MSKNTSAILQKLYPLVEKAMTTRLSNYKHCIAKFIDRRNDQLFATAPYDRIPYGTFDADEMFEAVGIDRSTVKSAISETYYWSIAAFNPRYAKDEITILMTTILRYFIIKKDKKNIDLTLIYLSFSGKFYPSIHYAMFPVAEPSKYAEVMDYVINNLTMKYDLKREGNIIATIRSISLTVAETYTKDFIKFTDERITYIVQQLHNRIKSFIKNIAILYYKAYENKDYITLNSDNTSDEDYHLADSDSLKAEKAIERSMAKIQSFSVDYRYCKMASDSLVKTEEIKQIIESIMNDRKNLGDIRSLIRAMVYTFFGQSKSKEVSDIQFLTFTISPKPNTKDPHIIQIKTIIEKWLDDYSERYRARKKRLATQNAYTKAIRTYFALIIHTANK